MAYIYTKDGEGVSNELLAQGEYEASIEKIEQKVTPNGKRKLSIWFRLRSDVEQEGKNHVVFDDIWAERDNPEYYNRKRLNQLIGTQHPEDGKTFAGIEDVIDFLTGSNVRLKIVRKMDDYRGAEVNEVSFYMATKSPAQTIGSADKPAVGGKLDLTDDDVPF